MMRRCKTCGAALGELHSWCGACGSAAPIPRTEPPPRHDSAQCFRAVREHLSAAGVALARVQLRRR